MLGQRAAVVGSGMAGLFTARVLSDWFDEVVLIDRDVIPDAPRGRSFVPQGRHFHALLPGGMQIAGQLFPGFDDELKAVGSVIGGPGDFCFYRPEGRSYAMAYYRPDPPRTAGLFYAQTRGLLEHCVRKRVEALPNVVPRYRTAVRDPLIEDGRVAGVALDGERLQADLVVDAAGRASRCDRWLPQLGYEPAPESVINVDFAYTSALFEPEDPDALEGVGFFVFPPLEGPYAQRGAAFVRMEDDRWIVSLGGRFGDYPPLDLPGFVEFAKTLPNPIVHELLGNAQPVTELARYRYPKAVRRHYERLERFPEGLLPIGDAFCHYNPVYGQGMSAAARQADALARLLASRAEDGRGLGGIALDWFPLASEEIRGPWAFAAAADFQNPLTTGDFPAEEAPGLEMFIYLSDESQTDLEAEQLLADVMMLTKPLSALFEPPWPERLAAWKGAP